MPHMLAEAKPLPRLFILRPSLCSPLGQGERRTHRSRREGRIPSRHHRSILHGKVWGVSWVNTGAGRITTCRPSRIQLRRVFYIYLATSASFSACVLFLWTWESAAGRAAYILGVFVKRSSWMLGKKRRKKSNWLAQKHPPHR